jgi:hypothetical protein
MVEPAIMTSGCILPSQGAEIVVHVEIEVANEKVRPELIKPIHVVTGNAGYALGQCSVVEGLVFLDSWTFLVPNIRGSAIFQPKDTSVTAALRTIRTGEMATSMIGSVSECQWCSM